MGLSPKDCVELREVLAGKGLGYRYAELERWLRRADCRLLKASADGSHRVWVHPKGRRIPVKTRGNRELLPAYIKLVARALVQEEACPDTP